MSAGKLKDVELKEFIPGYADFEFKSKVVIK